ncbi:MAG: hypothetical protein JXR94_18200, partial [Candidatus Hydrogenedentes bacterium]|nr:hypothetical protein [Candidatus Hydrogenedentota bacterium]
GLLSLMAGTDAARFLSVRCSLIVELLLAVAWGAAFFVEFDEGSARAKGLFRTYSLLRIAGLVLPFLIGNFAVLFHLAADAVLGALFLGRAPKVGE